MYIKNLLIKLSNNKKAIKLAKIIFKYFPDLKYKLIEFAYNNKNKSQKPIKYSNNFLEEIKKQINDQKSRI